MNITVVGAGPAGAWNATLLARRGHTVTLIDPQAPWEKPCGGGVTAKALAEFSIFHNGLPRQNIDRITIYFSDSNYVTVSPCEPIAVVSRKELGVHLLEEALRVGVSFLKTRVTRVQSVGREWILTTRETEVHADFLVGADGASSLVRRSVGQGLSPQDLCITLGYLIPGSTSSQMKIFFVPNFEGYIWYFPRPI